MKFTVIILPVLVLSLLVFGCLGGSSKTKTNLSMGDNQSAELNNTSSTSAEANLSNVSAPICSGPVCGSDGQSYITDCDAVKANVSILANGSCVEDLSKCNDSDGGVKPELSGITKKGQEVHADYCSSDSRVVEFACVDNTPTPIPMPCGDGQICVDGACIAPQNNSLCSGPVKPDIYVSDNVTLNGKVYSDTCIIYSTVKDYYCKGTSIDFVTNNCPPGFNCNLGKCEKMSARCTDEDNGTNTSVRAEVVAFVGINKVADNYDSCTDDATLHEYFCDGDNSSASIDLPCGSGFKCLTGRCVKSACSETDGGIDIYVKGTATSSNQTKTDFCTTDNSVREYHCVADDIVYDSFNCGDNYTCVDGQCEKN